MMGLVFARAVRVTVIYGAPAALTHTLHLGLGLKDPITLLLLLHSRQGMVYQRAVIDVVCPSLTTTGL